MIGISSFPFVLPDGGYSQCESEGESGLVVGITSPVSPDPQRFIQRTAAQTTKYTKHTKEERLTKRTRLTCRVDTWVAPFLRHFVCFVYFVVPSAIPRCISSHTVSLSCVSWFASSREYLSKTRRRLQRKGVSAAKLGKLPRGCRANSAGATHCSAGGRGVDSTTRLAPTENPERVSSRRQRGRGFRPPLPRARRRWGRFLRARAVRSAAGSGAPAPSRWLWGFAAAGPRPHRVPRPRR